MILGALLGAVLLLAFIMLPSWFMGWKGIVISIGITMGTVAIPFGEKNISFVRTWFLSTTIMVLIGGFMNYVRYLYHISVTHMLQWVLLFGAGSVGVLLFVIGMRKTMKENDNIYVIQIEHGTRKIVEAVYLDTGNLLMDPIFRKPVLVLCENVVNQCLIEEEIRVLENYKQYGRLDYSDLLSCPTQKKVCFHEIPYESVGQSSGRMLCLLLDRVYVLGVKEPLLKQPVAIVSEELFKDKKYKGLLHQECI